MSRPPGVQALILHGARGDPDRGWFRWLDGELERAGIESWRPRFPTPAGQSLDAWLAAHDAWSAEREPAPTILVGHSLGAAFALRLVERRYGNVAGLYLAAPFIGALGLPDYDPINASFFADPFDWTAIRARTGAARACWAGSDDPYVPLDRAEAVADGLRTPLRIVHGGGHLNDESGFETFPELRDAILACTAPRPEGPAPRPVEAEAPPHAHVRTRRER